MEVKFFAARGLNESIGLRSFNKFNFARDKFALANRLFSAVTAKSFT